MITLTIYSNQIYSIKSDLEVSNDIWPNDNIVGVNINYIISDHISYITNDNIKC